MAAGFGPGEFWALSPKLYVEQMQGARERVEREQRGRAWLAWHIEALARSKTLPAGEKFIAGVPACAPAQTPEIQQAMFDALARAWGAKTQGD